MLFFINCSENCKYQLEGKCIFDCTENTTLTSKYPCAYFKEKSKNSETDPIIKNSFT